MRTGAQTCKGGEMGLFFPRVAFHRFLTSDWLERPKVYHIARHGASPFRMAFRVRVALRNRCAAACLVVSYRARTRHCGR